MGSSAGSLSGGATSDGQTDYLEVDMSKQPSGHHPRAAPSGPPAAVSGSVPGEAGGTSTHRTQGSQVSPALRQAGSSIVQGRHAHEHGHGSHASRDDGAGGTNGGSYSSGRATEPQDLPREPAVDVPHSGAGLSHAHSFRRSSSSGDKAGESRGVERAQPDFRRAATSPSHQSSCGEIRPAPAAALEPGVADMFAQAGAHGGSGAGHAIGSSQAGGGSSQVSWNSGQYTNGNGGH